MTKDAGLQKLCLSLSYVEREKGKIAAMRSRQVTGEYGLSHFAINAAGPAGFAGGWLHVKKKIQLAASQLSFKYGWFSGREVPLTVSSINMQMPNALHGEANRPVHTYSGPSASGD